MRWYLVAIFAYLFTALQTSQLVSNWLAVRLFGHEARPDLLLVLALVVALAAEPWEAFIAAWGLGLLEDLIGAQGNLGVSALLFALAAWSLAHLRNSLLTDRLLTQVVLALLLVLAVRIPQQLLIFWLSSSKLGLSFALLQGVEDALYSALVAPLVVWLLVKTSVRRGTLRNR